MMTALKNHLFAVCPEGTYIGDVPGQGKDFTIGVADAFIGVGPNGLYEIESVEFTRDDENHPVGIRYDKVAEFATVEEVGTWVLARLHA